MVNCRYTQGMTESFFWRDLCLTATSSSLFSKGKKMKQLQKKIASRDRVFRGYNGLNKVVGLIDLTNEKGFYPVIAGAHML